MSNKKQVITIPFSGETEYSHDRRKKPLLENAGRKQYTNDDVYFAMKVYQDALDTRRKQQPISDFQARRIKLRMQIKQRYDDQQLSLLEKHNNEISIVKNEMNTHLHERIVETIEEVKRAKETEFTEVIQQTVERFETNIREIRENLTSTQTLISVEKKLKNDFRLQFREEKERSALLTKTIKDMKYVYSSCIFIAFSSHSLIFLMQRSSV